MPHSLFIFRMRAILSNGCSFLCFIIYVLYLFICYKITLNTCMYIHTLAGPRRSKLNHCAYKYSHATRVNTVINACVCFMGPPSLCHHIDRSDCPNSHPFIFATKRILSFQCLHALWPCQCIFPKCIFLAKHHYVAISRKLFSLA